jgi:hypothetical protein
VNDSIFLILRNDHASKRMVMRRLYLELWGASTSLSTVGLFRASGTEAGATMTAIVPTARNKRHAAATIAVAKAVPDPASMSGITIAGDPLYAWLFPVKDGTAAGIYQPKVVDLRFSNERDVESVGEMLDIHGEDTSLVIAAVGTIQASLRMVGHMSWDEEDD